MSNKIHMLYPLHYIYKHILNTCYLISIKIVKNIQSLFSLLIKLSHINNLYFIMYLEFI